MKYICPTRMLTQRVATSVVYRTVYIHIIAKMQPVLHKAQYTHMQIA